MMGVRVGGFEDVRFLVWVFGLMVRFFLVREGIKEGEDVFEVIFWLGEDV